MKSQERTFAETEVRQLIYVIGLHLPLNKLGDLYDKFDDLIENGRNPSITPLMRIARGTWADAGSYGVGGPDDENCDRPTQPLWP